MQTTTTDPRDGTVARRHQIIEEGALWLVREKGENLTARLRRYSRTHAGHVLTIDLYTDGPNRGAWYATVSGKTFAGRNASGNIYMCGGLCLERVDDDGASKAFFDAYTAERFPSEVQAITAARALHKALGRIGERDHAEFASRVVMRRVTHLRDLTAEEREAVRRAVTEREVRQYEAA